MEQEDGQTIYILRINGLYGFSCTILEKSIPTPSTKDISASRIAI